MNPTEAEIADMIHDFDRDSKYSILFKILINRKFYFHFSTERMENFNFMCIQIHSIENGTIDFCEFRDLVAGSRKDTDEDIRKVFQVSDLTAAQNQHRDLANSLIYSPRI